MGYASLRLSIMGVVGAVVAVAAGLLTSWWYAPVAGWAAAAASYIIVVWAHVRRLDAHGTRTHATREDPGIVVGELLIILGSIASVVAVAIIVLRAAHDHGAAQLLVAVLAFASVALTWTLIHTLYTLRYARLYYAALPRRIIDFGGVDEDGQDIDEPPRYVDFAYLAFDLGMTYQVSDTTIRTTAMRSVVLRHTLLSYVFGTVILASTINLVAGLSSTL